MNQWPDSSVIITSQAGNETSDLLLIGSFVGVGDGIHESQDIAKVISIGVNVLRLEDLVVTNGPDLFVYLSTDKSASDFMNLGRLKTSMLGSEDCIGSLVLYLHVCPLSFLPNRTLLSPTLYVA